MRVTQTGMLWEQSKTPPAGNRGLTTTTDKESVMATSQHTLNLPLDKSERPNCGNRGPKYACNRRPGHSGRHAFCWRHIDGLVRGVWA